MADKAQVQGGFVWQLFVAVRDIRNHCVRPPQGMLRAVSGCFKHLYIQSPSSMNPDSPERPVRGSYKLVPNDPGSCSKTQSPQHRALVKGMRPVVWKACVLALLLRVDHLFERICRRIRQRNRYHDVFWAAMESDDSKPRCRRETWCRIR